jgi:hypothetical protein
MFYARLIILLIAIALFLLPPVLFPPTLPREMLIVDEWAIDESADGPTDQGVIGIQADAGGWTALKLEGDLLYVDASGNLGRREREAFFLDYTDSGFFNTSQYHDILVQVSPIGDVTRTLESNAFPVFADEGLVLIDSDGLGISYMGEDGLERFSRRWASPISAVDAMRSDGGVSVLAALLDGRLFILDEQGNVLAASGGGDHSRFAIVYGATLTSLPVRTDPPGERLLVTAVEGHAPSWVRVSELSRGPGGQGQLRELVRAELPFDVLGPADLRILVKEDGGLDLAVVSPQGAFRYRFDPQTGALSSVEEFDPAVTDIVLIPIPEAPVLSLRTVSDAVGTEIFLDYREDGSWFRRSLDFPVVMRTEGNRLILRGGGLVSSYRLEEG